MSIGSHQNLLRHHARNIGQTEIAPAETIGQSLVIESQKVQNRGVKIVYVHTIFDGVIADVIGCAVYKTRFHPAAGHPYRIAVWIVISPVAAFADRRSPKFAGPNDQRIFQ